MKAADLIEFLKQFDPEVEVDVAVYDCGGYYDLYKTTGVSTLEFSGKTFPQLTIDVGCNSHKGWNRRSTKLEPL